MTLLHCLIQAGIAPRRHIVEALVTGQVLVNGQIVRDGYRVVDRRRDEIVFAGQKLGSPPKRVYLALNKPMGYLTTVRDDRKRKTVMELVPPEYRGFRLFPVGRLDADTEGLLLLTNDGDLAFGITHPRFEVEKEYEVSVKEPLTPSVLHSIETGVMLPEGHTAPAGIRRLTPGPLGLRYSIVIHEGKKRQIRRMFSSLGVPLRGLKRVQIGPVRLGSLQPGQVRPLRDEEIRALQSLAQGAAIPPRSPLHRRRS